MLAQEGMMSYNTLYIIISYCIISYNTVKNRKGGSMKYVVALMAIILVAVLAVTCQSMPATKGAVPDPTATLFAPGTAAPGVPVQFSIVGSGFPTTTTVNLTINDVSLGISLGSVTTNAYGCFEFAATQPTTGLQPGEVYAIEAYVGGTLWATFPWVAV
jgi:hypothetical protein